MQRESRGYTSPITLRTSYVSGPLTLWQTRKTSTTVTSIEVTVMLRCCRFDSLQVERLREKRDHATCHLICYLALRLFASLTALTTRTLKTIMMPLGTIPMNTKLVSRM